MGYDISMYNIAQSVGTAGVYTTPYSLYEFGSETNGSALSWWYTAGLDYVYYNFEVYCEVPEYITPVWFDPGTRFLNVLMAGANCYITYEYYVTIGASSFTGFYDGAIAELFPDRGDDGQQIEITFSYFDGVNSNAYQYNTGQYIYMNVSGCFLGKTKILLKDDLIKNIEDIQIGDKILAYNEKENKIVEDTVVKIIKHQLQAEYLIINEKINVTPNHRMYINHQWKKVEELKIGDYMLDSNLEKCWIYSIEKYSGAEYINTYNLKLLNFENYFAEGLLAHNKCPFIYSINEDGALKYENTFLYGLNSNYTSDTLRSDKIVLEYRKLKTFTNKFVIKEIEEETSYINYLALKLIDWDNNEYIINCKDEVLKEINDFEIVIEQGESYEVEFEEFDKNIEYKSIELVTLGYYLEK